MKNKLLATLALLALTWPAFSQTSDSVGLKNSLGIIVKKLNDEYFIEKHPVEAGFLAKRQINKSIALRLGVLGAFNKISQDYADWAPYFKDSTFVTKRGEIILGIEKQNKLTNRVGIGYGIDFCPFYSNQTQEKNSRFPVGNIVVKEETTTKLTTKGILFQPFLDIQYSLTTHIYIALDTRATLSYRNKTFNVTGTRGEDGTSDLGQITGSSERISFDMYYNPISSIQLIFKI